MNITFTDLLDQLQKALPGHTVQAKVASFWRAGETVVLLCYVDDARTLVVRGESARLFAGERKGDLLICPPTHVNRVALHTLLPETAPRALGRHTATMGLGDRLGILGAAQLSALEGSRFLPVLSQQSMREMTLTGRTFDDVIDAACFAVLEQGWRAGFGADGDHLKSMEDIQNAIAAGCSMITLDCSEALNKPFEEPVSAFQLRMKRYLEDAQLAALGIPISRDTLRDTMHAYDRAIALVESVQREILLPAGRDIDFELSIDEADAPTSYLAHYYVARELELRGVELTSLAPRFVGEFHKGVDYIGDRNALAADLAMHGRIAKHFGYKLSVHSGSDKYSIFPLIKPATNGVFHIKTSGTSWLTAVKVLAEREPALYRRIHACALAYFDTARTYYAVHAETERIPDIARMSDDLLQGLFHEDDSRQLIHITYGSMIGMHMPLREEIFAVLHREKAYVDDAVRENIRAHIESMGMLKNTFLPKLSLTATPEIIGNAPFLCDGDFVAAIHTAKQLGYDCVELHVANPDELNLPALTQALAETGISVSALGTGRAYVNDGLSLIDDDASRRQLADDRLMRFIDAAGTLQSIVIIGCLRGNIPDFSHYKTYEDRLAQAMAKADIRARERGVTVVFEPINRYENNYFCDSLTIREFILAHEFTNIKIMMDTYHMNIEEIDPAAAIVTCGSLVAYFHAADSNRRYPGCGHIDFAELFAALKQIGYNGVISAECLPLPDKGAASSAWIRNVKEMLANI